MKAKRVKLFTDDYRGICIDKHKVLSSGAKPYGKWVYGDLRRLGCGIFIGCADIDKALICPDTLCHCTGYADKNHKPIFENDIVKIITMDTQEERLMRVGYGEFNDINADDLFFGFYLEINDHNRKCCVSLLQDEGEYISQLEVVGNVFKNRELLKKIYEE